MKTKLSILFVFFVIVLSCNKNDDLPDEQDTTTTFKEGAGVNDVDGNTYNTVIISFSTGNTKSQIVQEWMTENLRATKYANGTTINNLAYCNEDAGTLSDLGYLYDWNAIMNHTTTAGAQGACPNGWHVPTLDEYNALIDALGGASIAGRKMKSTNTSYWNDVSLADDESGFHAHGTGWKMNFFYPHYKGATMFWTSTEEGDNARIIQLNSNSTGVVNGYGSSKTTQISCRCIKN